MGILAGPRHADAAATLTVVNLDGAGEGFNDPSPRTPVGGNPGTTLGAQRLFAFQHAANIWGGIIDSGVEIRIGANFDPQFCTATSTILGSAGPVTVVRDFTNAPATNTWYPVALANKLAGTDFSTNNDVSATFNSAIGTTCTFPNVWYYGVDGNPSGSQLDFVTVVLHEIGHGLGFLTLVSLGNGAKFQGRNDTYMLNLEDHSTGVLYPNMSSAERVTASTDTGDLHWVGPNVCAASGDLAAGTVGDHVRMYAPSPAQSGSSVSHYDTALAYNLPLIPNELMEPFLTGVIHDVGLTRELMEDIGWGLPNLTGVWTKTKEGCLAGICRAKGKFIVQNDGLAPSEPTVLRFFHSANATFDAGDTKIQADLSIGGLAGGETQAFKLKGTTATDGTPLGGFIIGVIDEDDDEIEQDETDNEIQSGGL